MDRDNQFGEVHKIDMDVPFFELEIIVAATENFSQAHKLGKGYLALFTRWPIIDTIKCSNLKFFVTLHNLTSVTTMFQGKFPGGEEIAVKRLSSNSGQGLVEFKNEEALIAKPQHELL